MINDGGTFEIISNPDENHVPDLGVTVLIDTSPANDAFSPSICNFIVKISAYHSTFGSLRYDPEQKVVRILAYQNIYFGSAPQHILDKSYTG